MEISKLIALGLYVIILFLIGYFASRRVKSMSDFYVGGKNMGFWAVAFQLEQQASQGGYSCFDNSFSYCC